MSRKQFFVAGTDTDVGKTLVACGLLHCASNAGLTTLALKPIAAGCEQTDEGLRNSDALMLQDCMTQSLAYEQVNPVALKEAIAPHLAAEREGRTLSVGRLVGFCRGALMKRSDFVLVEGAGGWRVPLNARESMSQLPVELNLPVVLVVGMKLGCLNHALLTVEAMRRDGVVLAGWVANRIDPNMAFCDENIETLERRIDAPCLGKVPFLDSADPLELSKYLDILPLISGG